MINCPNCNAQVPDGTRSCPSCGTVFPDTASTPQNQAYVSQNNMSQPTYQEMPQNNPYGSSGTVNQGQMPNYQQNSNGFGQTVNNSNTNYQQPMNNFSSSTIVNEPLGTVPQGNVGAGYNTNAVQWQPNDQAYQTQSVNDVNVNNGNYAQNTYVPNNAGAMPNQTPNYQGGAYNPNMPSGVPQGNGMYGPNLTAEQQDVENNKFMGGLSYIGILCLIPLFGAKNSPFAQYHAKQGLTLAILSIGWPIVKYILSTIFYQISWSLGITMGGILGIITTAVSIFSLVVGIIGIVNVCQGKCKELPLIGKIKILK